MLGGALSDADVDWKQAVAGEFMVYAIGMQSPQLESVLARLANETGGGHFQLKGSADLAVTFEHVLDELHRQYVIGFTPNALDGQTHKLAVKVTRRGLTPRARQSYVAAQ